MKGENAYIRAMDFYNNMYKNDMLLKGEAREKVYKKALTLIRKAAYQGHPEAQFELGQQYEDMNFLSVKNPYYNIEKMFYWYTKACDNGNANACNSLAYMYNVGEACEKDLKKALFLYKKSADLGSKIGKENHKLMQKQMSPGGKYYKK